MKTLKRILAIISLFVVIFAISYIVHTARQITKENFLTEAIYAETTKT